MRTMDDGLNPSARALNSSSWRRVAIVVHRYVGLAMAVFLVIVGVTGSLLAFKDELDAAVNPQLHRVRPPPGDAEMLDAAALRSVAISQIPADLLVPYMPLDTNPGKAVTIWAEPPEGKETTADDEYFFNPYTGQLLGSRKWGDLGQGAKNLIPFLYRLHFSLALGKVGDYLLGVIALLWTIDCFVGAYLTFPPRRRSGHSARSTSWLVRWKPAWLLRTNKLFSFVFTWHRASGLWVWAMLFVFAWSSVGLNLSEVYEPVMKAAFGMKDPASKTLPTLPKPRPEPELSFVRAHERGRTLMEAQATSLGFDIFEERQLSYHPARGAYRYRVYSSRDVSERYPATTLYFDGDNGRLLGFDSPTGRSAGNTITTWLYHLHWGSIAIGGVTYRVFVALMGLTVAALSTTGVWIWWRKQANRRRRSRRPSGENQRTWHRLQKGQRSDEVNKRTEPVGAASTASLGATTPEAE